MKRSIGMCAIWLAVAACPASLFVFPALPEESRQTAAGVVYNDLNGNQRQDAGEPGIPGVGVSNGRNVVKTDAAGEYRLPVEGDAVVFVIKPSGWKTVRDGDNVPRFYYVHRPGGSPNFKFPGSTATGPLPSSIDFPLTKQVEPSRFRVVLFGDPQVRNQKEVNYLAHDVVEELIGTDAAFGITLGDASFEDLSVFPAFNHTVGRIGIPFYTAPGNHDLNFDSPGDEQSLETFQRTFGPRYYSFDYGPVHFLILDTVIYEGSTAARPKGGYSAGIDPNQMEFIKNDLALVPPSRLVALFMHYPIVSIEEKLNMKGRQALYRLIEKRPSFSVSGHRHYQDPRFITSEDGWEGGEPHFHLVLGTVCGSWWRGVADEVGIPHATMSDGTPNGYALATFDGVKYSLVWKVARRPADYQMNVFVPEQVSAATAQTQEVLVNVFLGTDRSVVEMRLGDNGPWAPMRKVLREDPYYVAMKSAEEKQSPEWIRANGLPKAILSPHIWSATLPANPPVGTQVIHVRTTDMFGHTYKASRVVTISE